MTLHTIQRALEESGCDALTVAQKHAIGRVLEPMPAPPKPKHRRVIRNAELDRILMIVSQTWHITRGCIRERDRTPIVAEARHAFCWLARKETTMSFAAIAAYLDGRDHAAIVNGALQANDLRDSDARFAAKLNSARERVRTGTP